MTPPDSDPHWRDTLHRWRTENSADTRPAGGPCGRVYAVPFAHVWDELTGIVERRARWTLRHKDEELGIISVACRTPVFRFTDDLTIWVSLDSDGLTRVEALSRSRVGRADLGVNRRRIVRLLRGLDAMLGRANRLEDRRSDERSRQVGHGAGDRAPVA